jgi:hypothetical protein
MTLESTVRVTAGSLVLLSLLLYLLISPWGLLLALFVGLNLVQSAFTGFCPAEKIFAALGVGASRPDGAPGESTS